MKFIDEVSIRIASGKGGAGAVSFRREAMTPRGGPDGGDGGRGGDVILRVAKNINSLVDYKYNRLYAARDGQPGSGANMFGAAGDDLVMLVPAGTIVRSAEGEILVDMTGLNEYTLLKGGRGGKGNTYFKNSVNQAPEFAQPGESGTEIEVKLELKLIADVGIIGFPNAGKSTLISRISAAKPKIADYPFTTLTPNLGVVKSGEYSSFVVADIPGLVKGAHQGVGLGIQFLKHIERTKLFIHLIDASGISGRSPMDDYLDLCYEIKMYDEQNEGKEGFFPLSTRPQIVVLNKIDTLTKEDTQKLQAQFKSKTGVEPMLVSAVSGVNIKELILKVSQLISKEDEQ